MVKYPLISDPNFQLKIKTVFGGFKQSIKDLNKAYFFVKNLYSV